MKILNTIQKLYHVLKLQSGNMVRFLCEKRSELIRAIKFGANLTKFLPNTDVKNEQLRTLGSAIYQPDQFEM